MKKTVAIVSGAPALFERPDVRMIVPATAAGSNRGSAALMPDVCASEMLYAVSGSGGVLMPGNTQVGDRLYFSIDSLRGKGIGNQRALGYRHTDEAKKKISDAGVGREFSAERRAKIGATKIGNKYSLGRTVSAETKEKIAAAQRGVPRPYARIGDIVRGKPWSAARRAAQKAKSS